eukprot:3303324-Pleurochrysis_carterae.AAC.1
MPDGKTCSKGTCHFAHDLVNPGGPCYRDPRWPGPLPEKVAKNKQQVERIRVARDANAKRMGVTAIAINMAFAQADECGMGFQDEVGGFGETMPVMMVAPDDGGIEAQG